ncbi:MAG: DUF6788 family protein [Cyanobacteria bacterium J06627_28]
MANYERLKRQIQRLPLDEKQALKEWLTGEIESELIAPDVENKAGREVVKTAKEGRTTYQAELVRCGKPNCRCADGESLHGPYWYGYRKEKGKLKSWYIGKKIPKQLTED